MRTGASAAVSAKWLARKNSKTLAIVGAGHMAEGTLATCNEIFAWDEVRVWSRSQATLDAFRRGAAAEIRVPLVPSLDLEQAVRGADVVVTITPARGPIVKDEWIAPGTHIAAVGADKAGDQELDPAHPPARADLRRRHPPVPHRRRDQRAALARSDHGGRHRRRDRPSRRGQAWRGARPTTRSRCSTRPGSRCRTPPPSRSSTSARRRRGRRREEDDLYVGAGSCQSSTNSPSGS